MKFFGPLVHFLFHVGYFGPLLMGILDSSFLVLPFGNDLLVVGMVARYHQRAPGYVLAAACGSTMGACLLALAFKKLGEEGIRRIAGKSQYEKLKNRVGSRSGVAIAVAALSPPPFPYTTVIAAVSALDYSLWRILLINFLARGVRFAILAALAIKFGPRILGIAKSAPFEWSMFAFIVLCLVASGFSVARWLRRPRTVGKEPRSGQRCESGQY